jgi:hypothetical protein
MLHIAYKYKEQLQNIWFKFMQTPRSKFYNLGSWYNFELNVEKDNWSNLQFVSVDKKYKAVQAYFYADFHRDHLKYHNVAIVIFNEQSYTAKKDLTQFLNKLKTDPRSRKIEWSVVIGNKNAERMYDKIIDKHHGRITGLEHKSVRLQDGKFYDIKHYELFTP